jgi:DNA polymerase-4
MRRSIFFIDPPAFCTTVEGLVAPDLRARPVAVAPPGADRATILALSPEARGAGLERGTPVRLARKQCPDLIVIPPNPHLYARASRALHDILKAYAPVIEPRWYGHAFLDLTGTERLFGPPGDIAARIRREAQARLGLPLSIGVATNKLVSQTATTVAPVNLLEIPRGQEARFLAPQLVRFLPELTPWVRERLDDYQLDVIGDIAALTERQITSVLPVAGGTLLTRARGIDTRPVLPPEVRQLFQARHTLATDTNDLGVLHPLLRRLSERIGHRLRMRHLVARRLSLRLVYADFTELRRQAPLRVGGLDVELWDATRRLFTKTNAKRIAVRAVALAADRLLEADGQLDLWHVPSATERRETVLQGALDHITTRWGTTGVRRGQGPARRLAAGRS